jgi:putative hydrolase of the HAD superfamily
MVRQDDSGYAPRETYFRWVAERFGSGTLAAAELWEDYQSKLPLYISRNEAICELLGRLAATYRLAIVSNGSSRNQRRKLMQTGLAEICSVVLISGETGVEKPDPAMFRLALDALDCDAESALFVGDDPDRDIAGASRAGLMTCWVALGRSLDALTVKPTFHIKTILELETLVLHERQGIDRHA